MSGWVEHFGGGNGPIDLEAVNSLASHLGTDMHGAAQLLRNPEEYRAALARRDAERRSACTCGCQDGALPGSDVLACEAFMRRRYLPAG